VVALTVKSWIDALFSFPNGFCLTELRR